MSIVKLEREEFLRKHTGYLNEKQLQAVQTIEGPVLLLADPDDKRCVWRSAKDTGFG